jgi:hypothetical protein
VMHPLLISMKENFSSLKIKSKYNWTRNMVI